MSTTTARPLRLLALTAAGFLIIPSLSAQYVFTNSGGDQLWSNPENWNQATPPPAGEIAWINFTPSAAIINYDAGSPGELVIGQGGGDGAVQMTSGGAISTPHINMAWGDGRNGTWTQDGGATAVAGELRAGRGAGGGTATVNISGGTFQSGHMFVGDANVATNIAISGGMVSTTGTTGVRLSDVASTSTATSSLAVTGGTLDTHLIGIGARSGGTGSGALTIGGNAVVNVRQNIFMRGGNNSSVTVDGSGASITASRNGGTGFEVHSGSSANFIFDASGVSTINLNGDVNGSRLQFSNLTGEQTGILNVDLQDYTGPAQSVYLFRFSDTISGGVVGAGEFSAHNLTLAQGSPYSGSFEYIRDQGVAGNGLVLHVIPEPSTYAAIFGGAIFLLALIRRRARLS